VIPRDPVFRAGTNQRRPVKPAQLPRASERLSARHRRKSASRGGGSWEQMRENQAGSELGDSPPCAGAPRAVRASRGEGVLATLVADAGRTRGAAGQRRERAPGQPHSAGRTNPYGKQDLQGNSGIAAGFKGRVFDEGSAHAMEACSPKSRSYVVFRASSVIGPSNRTASHSVASLEACSSTWRAVVGRREAVQVHYGAKRGRRAFISYVAQQAFPASVLRAF